MTDDNINNLKKQISDLELAKKRKDEEAQLQKRLKQLQFENSTLGHIAGGISKASDVLTRPAQKDAQGRPIPNTGGPGARLLEMVHHIGSPAPQPNQTVPIKSRQQVVRQIQQAPHQSAMEGFSDFLGTPQQSQPMQMQSMRKTKVMKTMKNKKSKMMRQPRQQMQTQPQAFDMDAYLKSLPQ